MRLFRLSALTLTPPALLSLSLPLLAPKGERTPFDIIEYKLGYDRFKSIPIYEGDEVVLTPQRRIEAVVYTSPPNEVIPHLLWSVERPPEGPDRKNRVLDTMTRQTSYDMNGRGEGHIRVSYPEPLAVKYRNEQPYYDAYNTVVYQFIEQPDSDNYFHGVARISEVDRADLTDDEVQLGSFKVRYADTV